MPLGRCDGMDLMKESYYLLLDAPLWKTFRQEFVRSKGYTCEKCGRRLQHGLQVHHKVYRAGRKPWEYGYSDLQCLCVDCHRQLHTELFDAGRKIPVYDDEGNRSSIPDEACCRHCGGEGFVRDYSHLLGGICFWCFGTGMRFVHRYSKDEARRYSYRIYNQWLARQESIGREVTSERFTCAGDVERWLLSMNERQ